MSSTQAPTDVKAPRKVGKAVADAIARGAPNIDLVRRQSCADARSADVVTILYRLYSRT